MGINYHKEVLSALEGGDWKSTLDVLDAVQSNVEAQPRPEIRDPFWTPWFPKTAQWLREWRELLADPADARIHIALERLKDKGLIEEHERKLAAHERPGRKHRQIKEYRLVRQAEEFRPNSFAI